MALDSMDLKEKLMQVVEQLPADRRVEVLDFALFVRTLGGRQGGGVDSGSGVSQPCDPLHGMVVHYEDPFEPVAEADWEALR